MFISRLRNPDLENLFKAKQRYFGSSAFFTQDKSGSFRWPKVEKNSIKNILSIKKIRQCLNLVDEIKRSKIHRVVFDNGDPANIIIGFFLKGSGIRLTYTIHDQVPHDGNRLVGIYNWIITIFLADELIVFSAVQMRTKAKVLHFKLGGYLGEYTRIRAGRSSKAQKVVLFFGRVENYKGYEFIPLIKERLNAAGVKIVIAGRGQNDTVDALKGNDDIEIINRFISDHETVSLFNTAHVCMLPYKEATQSGVLLLSASFGVPCVAFSVGAINEYMLPEIGKSVKPGDIDAFAESIIDYAQLSSEGWDTIQKKCRNAYMEHFSERVYVQQYEKLLTRDLT